MLAQAETHAGWMRARIVPDQVRKYMSGHADFIPEREIEAKLLANHAPDAARVREIIAKAESIETLEPDETAALLAVTDAGLWEEMKQAAGRIKRKVYDNRIVTFAPLYLGNRCVNDCLYCGLRRENASIRRRILSQDEIRREVEVLAGRIGHKRLIVVYGEHPASGIDYMAESLRTIYGVRVKARKGWGQIRRVNVNAPPLRVEELKVLHEVGLGTYQVFQETYHHGTYNAVHPRGSIKSDYAWRLYAMHRAMEAGIDDVGIGALFGLYDWRFEVMGLLYHARELERAFGIGPHTISFPRIEPAEATPFVQDLEHRVDDEAMERAVVVLRLSVPYTGMILTAREDATMRRRLLPLGCTQTDASSRIGIGAYSDAGEEQEGDRQQFLLGDTRSLDDVVRELAEMGWITSFCTAGYRCGRTGQCIMDLLRSGKEGKFCKLNAVITFREWLDDFASPGTQAAGERVLRNELEEIRAQNPKGFPVFMEFYERTARGERDLYF
jgi:2-iminoacetate synthase